jgi:hypothetical protein
MSVIPKRRDLTWVIGATNRESWQFGTVTRRNDQGEEYVPSGSEKNLTGYSAVIIIQTAPDTTALAEFSTDNNKILDTDFATGILTVENVARTELDNISPGTYEWFLEMTSPAGEVDYYLAGQITIRRIR